MAPTTKSRGDKTKESTPKKTKVSKISKKEELAKASKTTASKVDSVTTPRSDKSRMPPSKSGKSSPVSHSQGKNVEKEAKPKSKGGKPGISASAARPQSSKGKAPTPSPGDPDAEGSGEPSGVEEEEDEEEIHLHGFSSEGEDSSDEEDGVQDGPALDVAKLPTIAKDDETVRRKLEKAKRQPTQDRGVIFLGRIPHGFYEDEMKAYFTQFGTVTRLRLSRNKKTGRSKHYAFVEFDSSSVAQIVSETMDNYLLLGHILRCKVIPKDEVHPELWVGANRKWRVVPRDRVARVQQNKPRTAEEQGKAESRLLNRQDQKKRKLQEAGIDYNFDAVAYKKKAAPITA